MISSLLGGIGLFLLGMTLMSEGLKSFAGDSLRKALLAFTKRPITAFFSGMFATALVQSSSATTLMTIGFVSAGLLPFSQSVGVLIGASLGTTSTGWIVSLIGLNLSISSYALLFVAVGAAARLFLKGRAKALGTAVAGFGLVFLGIDLLKTGMGSLATEFDFSALPSGSFGAHLVLAMIGVLFTILMQSCSAAMATNLTALYSGALNFEQSAALAIGAAVGTTVTAALASIGGSIHAKRTALAHISFNLTTACLALLLMPLLLQLIYFAQRNFGLEPGAVSLALFHSLFISMGVVLFLPFLKQFSGFIEKLLPEKSPGFTRFLDDSLLSMPSVAMESVWRALLECRAALAEQAERRIKAGAGIDAVSASIEQVRAAVNESRQYLSRMSVESEDRELEGIRINYIHAMDHLQRLSVAIAARDVLPGTPALLPWEKRLCAELKRLTTETGGKGTEKQPAKSATDQTICDFSASLAEWRKSRRKEILEAAAHAGANPETLLQELETLHWLDQIAYHLCRIEYHFGLAQFPKG